MCFVQNISYLQKKIFLYTTKTLFQKKTFYTENIENICVTNENINLSELYSHSAKKKKKKKKKIDHEKYIF